MEHNEDHCLSGSCDFETNTCEYTDLCSETLEIGIEIPTCLFDMDCNDGNTCTAEFCLDGICQLKFDPDAKESNCCKVDTDCPDIACQRAWCHLDSYTCRYVPTVLQAGCPGFENDPEEQVWSPPSYSSNPLTAQQIVGGSIGGGVLILLLIATFSLGCLVIYEKLSKV
jgi:hypothetical protein